VKEWTRHEARSKQTTEAQGFNDQHRSFRSQIAGLDRAQYPQDCLTDAMIKTNAMHKVWVFAPWNTGVTGARGEQTVIRADTSVTRAEQFRGVTYQEFGSGWLTAFETTLDGHKGGSLLVEWGGNVAIQGFYAWTKNTNYATSASTEGVPNEQFMGLRILLNGNVIADRIGPAKPQDSFVITGEQQVPSGDVVLTCQFQPRAAGPDDPVEDSSTNDHLLQAHMWGNRVFCIGRWR